MQYEVRFEIEIAASTPERAARTVRDMMLDPEESLNLQVYEIHWEDEFKEFSPDLSHGWQGRFNKGVDPVMVKTGEWKSK